MAFLDDNYLLSSEVAGKIFNFIKKLPIIDAHNHANVKEIAENKNYSNVWQLFAATDHYVWEVLRKRGVKEKFITGDASPKEKWIKMAEVFPEVAGNPVYEWIHLDLKRYLGIDLILNAETAEEIWQEANNVLAGDESKPQALLKKIGVEVMCSTDDPIDSLKYHPQVNAVMGNGFIRPTWRPDKAMNIFAPGWRSYMRQLEERFSISLKNIENLKEALRRSHDFFAEHGCIASDHGVEVPFPAVTEDNVADKIFKKAFNGELLSREEIYSYMDWFFGFAGELDSEKGWVFQMHIGAVRDIRDSLFKTIGPDSGGDVSNHYLDILTPLKGFLNRFDNRLKVVLYCLDPSHTSTLATVSRAFGEMVNLGSAWWLNDTPIGMKRQLEYIASVDTLANFAGMVSDSRKLLSYGSRFEMFRRVMSDVLGTMVNNGQMPLEVAISLAKKMAYDTPKNIFGL